MTRLFVSLATSIFFVPFDRKLIDVGSLGRSGKKSCDQARRLGNIVGELCSSIA